MEVPSDLKKDKRNKLANVIGVLLEEQRKKELIWEKIQKKRHEESTKYVQAERKVPPKVLEHHQKFNHTLRAKQLKKLAKEFQGRYEVAGGLPSIKNNKAIFVN